MPGFSQNLVLLRLQQFWDTQYKNNFDSPRSGFHVQLLPHLPVPQTKSGSGYERITRIRMRTKYPDEVSNKTPGSVYEQITRTRLKQNSLIRIRTKHPDPDANKTPGSGCEQNTRIQLRTNTQIPNLAASPINSNFKISFNA